LLSPLRIDAAANATDHHTGRTGFCLSVYTWVSVRFKAVSHVNLGVSVSLHCIVRLDGSNRACVQYCVSVCLVESFHNCKQHDMYMVFTLVTLSTLLAVSVNQRSAVSVCLSVPYFVIPIKVAFHDADTDTDILADILAKMSACRSDCHRNNFSRACRTCRRGSSRGSRCRCRCRSRGMRA